MERETQDPAMQTAAPIPFFQRLGVRLALLFIALLLPLAAFDVWQTMNSRERRINQAVDGLARAAGAVAERQRDTIASSRELLTALARSAEVRAGGAADCAEILSRMAGEFPRYAVLSRVEPDGSVACSSRALSPSFNALTLPYVANAFTTGSFTVSRFSIDPISGLPVLAFALPVPGPDGRPSSVLAAGLSLAWIRESLAALERLPQGVLWLFDGEGEVLATHPEQGAGPAGSENGRAIFRLAASGLRGSAGFRGGDGREHLAGFAPVAEVPGGLYAAVTQPRELVLAPLNRAALVRVGLFFAVALACLGLGMFASRRFILRFTEGLAAYAAGLGQGRWDARPDIPQGGGELGRLARAMDSLAGELKSRTEALKASEERLRLALSGSNDGIWDWNMDTGETYLSPRYKEILGYRENELKGRAEEWSARLHPDDAARAYADVRAHVEGDAPFYENEHRLRHKDGTWRWVRARGRVVRDAQGRAYRMVGASTDITEHKAVGEALRRSEERLRLALSGTNDGVWDWDLTTNKVDFSPRWKSMLGYGEDEVGDDISEWSSRVHPEDLDAALADAKAHLEGRTPLYENVHRVRHKEGFYLWILDRGLAVRDAEGRAVRMVGAHTDITQLRAAQEALRQSEARFRSYFETGMVGMAVTSPDKGWIEVNDRLCDLLGYPREELDRKTWAEITHPEDLAADMALFEDVLAGRREGYSLEKRFVRKDGRIIHASIDVGCVRREDRSIDYFTALVQDISDRKAAEEALRFRNALLTTQQEASPDGILVEGMDRTALLANRQYARMWGLAEEVAPGVPARQLMERILPLVTDPEGFTARIEDLFSRPDEDADDEILLADGRIFERHTKSLMAEGECLGRVWFYRDVTEKRLAERFLKEGEARIRAMSEASIDALVLIDAKGDVLFWNPAAEAMFGYSADEALGRNVHELIAPAPVRPRADAGLRGFADTGAGPVVGNVISFEAMRKDGSLFFVERAVNSFFHNGQWYAVGVVRDITERRAAEAELARAKAEADEANRAKGDFLARMSHEIRTPMNAILGLTHLALQTPLDERQADYLRKVETSGRTLLRLLNDILDFSKIEAGKMSLEDAPFVLEEVLERAADTVLVAAEQKGLELFVSVDPEAPRVLVGDPLRLGQVLINLLNNAVKFTASGEVVLVVGLADPDPERPLLRFEVRDTGPGIPPDKVEQLFEAFTQAEASTTRRYGGTGLGLAICRRLVEMMGGEIGAESSPDRGSVFRFTVRFRPGPPRPWPLAGDFQGLRVLVAENNETGRAILTRYLAAMGLSVAAAPDGRSAVNGLVEAAGAGAPYGLFLLDLDMPGMDGLETLRVLSSELEQDRRPPVVLMASAFLDPVLGDRARALGAKALLSKPVNPSSLLDAVLEALGRPAAGARAASVRAAGLSLAGVRLLVVEDNAINQQVAREILEGAGARVRVASSGREALTALAAGSFDAALMDIQMPDMDGFETTRRIRAGERHADLPVIAMTAHAMAGDRERCLAAGMNDHVAKPIEPGALFETLARHLPGLIAPAQAGPVAAVPAGPAPDQALDRVGALARLSGNRTLYAKLLRDFAADHGGDDRLLAQALDRGDQALSARLAHTLKGVAGSLGARRLAAAAAALDEAFKKGDSGLARELIPALSQALESVLAEAREAADALAPAGAEQPAPVPAEAGESFRRLAFLLRQGDAEAGSAAADLAAALKETPVGPALAKAAALASAFDYDEALAALTAAAQGMGLEV